MEPSQEDTRGPGRPFQVASVWQSHEIFTIAAFPKRPRKPSQVTNAWHGRLILTIGALPGRPRRPSQVTNAPKMAQYRLEMAQGRLHDNPTGAPKVAEEGGLRLGKPPAIPRSVEPHVAD